MRWHQRLGLLAFVLFCAVVLGRCDGFREKLTGEFNAGAADPVNFPPPYRGINAVRNISGSGNGLTAVRAFADGGAVEYFLFPYGTSQIVTPGYIYTTSAIASQAQTATRISGLTAPLAYVFDPPGSDSPLPREQRCVQPPGYQYDPRRDDVHYDEQGNIFAALPSATFNPGSLPTWSYVPIIREVPVTSNGESCQDIKSEKTLLQRGDVSVPKPSPDAVAGTPDGRYLAWALIDPGIPVYHVDAPDAGSTGVGIQRWGWYQQFLVAYLEGGYLPIDRGTTFVAQNLYLPSQIRALNPVDGGVRTSAGQLAQGYDVLDFPRGDPRYSPICRVQLYAVTVDQLPDGGPALDQLPTNAGDTRIQTSRLSDGGFPPPQSPAAGAIVPSTTIPPFVFCLQVQ